MLHCHLHFPSLAQVFWIIFLKGVFKFSVIIHCYWTVLWRTLLSDIFTLQAVVLTGDWFYHIRFPKFQILLENIDKKICSVLPPYFPRRPKRSLITN